MDKTITLFADKKPETPAIPNNFNQEMVGLQRRLKMVEESIANLRRQEQLNEQNVIQVNKKVTDQLKDFEGEIRSISQSVEKMRTDLRMIIAELQTCAKTEDLLLLKKYVNMINPVNFVTQAEIEDIIEEKLRKLK